MRIGYRSFTGVVQTTKVGEPAPETGFGLFGFLQLHPRSLLHSPHQEPRFSPARCQHLPARSANKILQEAFVQQINNSNDQEIDKEERITQQVKREEESGD
jgi:hypothetical protein